MLISYLRSSSQSKFVFCQHSFYLEYVLGFRPGANYKADMGTCTHKALEILGYWKLATQNNEPTFTDGETGVIFSRDNMTVDKAINCAWEFYTKPTTQETQWGLKGKIIARSTPFEWEQSHKDTIAEWVYAALKYNDGMFSVLKRNVVTPEKYFDIELPHEWAKYKYKSTTGEIFEGRWSIKGTMDLVTKIDDDTLEVVDYKSGKCLDWNNMKPKDFTSLTRDAQLILYFYAARKLFPQYKTIMMTIFFIRDGGAYTLPYDESHERYAELMLRQNFEKIQATMKPALLNPSKNKNDWLKCNRFCHFGKTKFLDEATNQLTDQTICAKMREEIVTLGIDRVQEKWGKPGANNTYQGGGKTIEAAP